jgi:sec-independent protein translocase protein TatC
MATPDPTEPLAEGTLISHLLELRSRLLRAVVAVLVVTIPAMLYANDLFGFVARPLVKVLPKGSAMISTSVMAPLTTPFKLAFYVALISAMPYVLYQIWAFVAPGLYRHEKRFALPLLVSSIGLFYAGITFCYYVVFSHHVRVLHCDDAARRADDDGHDAVPRFCTRDVSSFRRRFRDSRRNRVAGGDRACQG